jgi:hypothetical protein
MKKIKIFLSIIIKIIILIILILSITWICGIYKDNQEKNRRESIQKLIDTEIASLNKSEGNNKEPQNNNSSQDNNSNSGIDWDSAIQDSIGNMETNSAFSDITMLTSSTFKATLNQEEKIFHLIGVADDGDMEAVKKILSELKHIVITYDVRKTKDGVHQIYLWNGSNENVNNMVNIQLIKQDICNTNYSGTSYIETPNVQYSQIFIYESKH